MYPPDLGCTQIYTLQSGDQIGGVYQLQSYSVNLAYIISILSICWLIVLD